LPEIQFETRSGRLTVYKESDGYLMDFPSDRPQPREFPGIEQVLGCEVKNTALGVSDILVEVDNQKVVEGLSPDFRAMMDYDARGVIVTAPGREEDIVSRCFFPSYGIDEDPVTGSAHTTLFSYWGDVWGKSKMTARQLSARQGLIQGELRGNRVWLKGNAVLYLEGQIYLPD
jgi:predicted PhzF superfamily epimerase YddE/YHI9